MRRLEGAERGDARQDEARAAAGCNKFTGERRRSALRRQIDGCARKIEGICGGKAGDEHAIEQRVSERRQERRSGGECEDICGQGRARAAKGTGRQPNMIRRA